MARRLACAGVIAAALLGPVTDAPAAEVVVLRGAAVETVETGPAKGVTVLKGRPAQGKVPQPTPSYGLRAGGGPRLAASGSNLWFIDGGGRVRACFLQGTGHVGRLKVVCTR